METVKCGFKFTKYHCCVEFWELKHRYRYKGTFNPHSILKGGDSMDELEEKLSKIKESIKNSSLGQLIKKESNANLRLEDVMIISKPGQKTISEIVSENRW
jgi:hypothetical protein